MKNNENMTITVAFDWHNNEAKLRKELAGFIKDGTYPADLKVGKVEEVRNHLDAELTFNSVKTLVEFYTVFLGGDREHAVSELKEFYGIDA